MTNEQKELLLKDLCGRLTYGVKATTTSNGWRDVYLVSGYTGNRILLDCPVYDEGDDEWLVEFVKPYLRSMSSMTEEEKDELYTAMDWYGGIDENGNVDTKGQDKVYRETFYDYTDWLNAHHFDYRGLIEKGLALEAPEGMYEIK